MEVSQVVKTKEGLVKFEGILSQEESDIVIGLGLNFLLAKGFINNLTEEEQEVH